MDVQRLKGLLVEALALLEGDPERAAGEGRFVQQVSRVLSQRWPDHDFTPEQLSELYRLSEGDATTVGSLIARCAFRRSRGWQPDSLSGYLLATVRKVGIAQLRAEREARLARLRSSIHLAEPYSVQLSEPYEAVKDQPEPVVPQPQVVDPVDELMALLREGGS
jgi:hypothetical protein